jgi:hypothetical protein
MSLKSSYTEKRKLTRACSRDAAYGFLNTIIFTVVVYSVQLVDGVHDT